MAADTDLTLRVLPSRHRDRTVEQQLVGDVHPGRDRRLHRELPGVEVGAVAEVLHHVVGSARSSTCRSTACPRCPCR